MASGNRSEHQDEEPVDAERTGWPGAEGAGGDAGGDSEVTHGDWKEHT